MNLLLVEDEAILAEAMLAYLRHQGYAVMWADSLHAAYQHLMEFPPDLVVLDITLPEGEDAGFTLANDLRSSGFQGGILFLTARDAIEDRVRGLDVGGDDYLIKPFALPEFAARIRALLRREAQTRQARLARGPLEVDLSGRMVRWNGEDVNLTEREFALLEYLSLHPERVFSAEELTDRFFADTESGVKIVRVYVHHLRQKIAPDVIQTLSSGYRLGV